MKSVAAGAHFWTVAFEPAKFQDDRATTAWVAISISGANTSYLFLQLSELTRASRDWEKI